MKDTLVELANTWIREADRHSLAADECCPPEDSSISEFFECDLHSAEGQVYYTCAKQLLAALS